MDIHDARSVEQLINLYRKGKCPQYLFFWGHTNKNPEMVNQSCLSNWFSASFELDGVQYPTTEHYMMSEKAQLFDDKNTRLQIISAGSPEKAKALGRQVSGFIEETW